MIHEIVGHTGSLYFTGMRLDSDSLMFEARKSFLGRFDLFSWCTCLIRILRMMVLVEWNQEVAHLFELG